MRTVGYVGPVPRETKCLRTNRRRFRRGKSTNGSAFDPNAPAGWKSLCTRELSIPIRGFRVRLEWNGRHAARHDRRVNRREKTVCGVEILVRFCFHRLAESREVLRFGTQSPGIINANQSCETPEFDWYRKNPTFSLYLCVSLSSSFITDSPWWN